MNKLNKEVEELAKEGKLQEALEKILKEVSWETMDIYGITTCELIKASFEESEVAEEEESITSFNQLKNNKYYTLHEDDSFLSQKIVIYEISEDLIDCLLSSVA